MMNSICASGHWRLQAAAALIAVAVSSLTAVAAPGPLRADQPIRGWTILSDREPDAMAVIAAAPGYRINQLQLSHQLVDNLRDLREPERRAKVTRLIDAGHAAGIQEVVLWDHALYDLDYYPARFRTGPGGTLDLDNRAFWDWLRQDYRELLDLAPGANGVVLTFIETGARAERQHSTRLRTSQDKLAAVVNAVADVVIGERHLNLYARTFSYTQAEYAAIIGAVAKFARPEVRLMMKETPHDFFLTHPADMYAGTIARPTLIEFDAAGEFNGQGLIANTWPEYMLARARDLLRRPHVTGYVARTDRYGDTRIIGRPSEINLLALARYVEDPQVTSDEIYDAFITKRYGAKAVQYVKSAFRNAFGIVTSTLYTLGTNTANHSALDYDPYGSSYARHVSGKWLDPPVVYIRNDVNREYHYWKEIINRLAPPWAKAPANTQLDEVPWVRQRGWLQAGEQMDQDTLIDIILEKTYGTTLAEQSLGYVELARPALSAEDYKDLNLHFERTLATARLHRVVATAYFGFRLWARGGAFQTPDLAETVRAALNGIPSVAYQIEHFRVKPPVGQWKWVDDAAAAQRYYDWITKAGWPKETNGVANPYGGMTFPMK
jgi:hypothetical protein